MEEYAANKNITINTKTLDKLLILFKNVLDNDNEELIYAVNKIISKIVKKCQEYSSQVYYRAVGGRKHHDRQVEWSHGAYEKNFNEVLTVGVKEINNEIIKIVTQIKEVKLDGMESIVEIVKIMLYELNKNLA